MVYRPVFPGGVKVHFVCRVLRSNYSAPVLTLHMGCVFNVAFLVVFTGKIYCGMFFLFLIGAQTQCRFIEQV